jgi:hypothetical protein
VKGSCIKTTSELVSVALNVTPIVFERIPSLSTGTVQEVNEGMNKVEKDIIKICQSQLE